MAAKPKKKARTIKKTAVRNTAIPKMQPQSRASVGGTGTSGRSATATSRKEITADMIAKKAYEIWKTGKGGTDLENWVRAERELRGS